MIDPAKGEQTERSCVIDAPRPHARFLSWPHSRAGRTAAALATLFLIVLGLNLWTASDGHQNGLFVFATFVTAMGALAALVLSAVAIVRHHERSLLVLLPLAIGVLVFAFLAVEIVVGHD
jgi:hypothetical protein